MIKDGKISSDVQMAMRLMGLYSLMTYGISAVTNFDFTRLVANDTFDFMTQVKDWITADPESAETAALSDQEAKKKYGSFFGAGPILGNLGPFVSDVVMMAEIYDFWNRTPDEHAEMLNHKYAPDDPDLKYTRDRIISNAGARWKWHVIPSLMSGQYEKAARQVTGLYKPQWVNKWIPIDPFNNRDRNQAFYKTRDEWLRKNPYSVVNLYEDLALGGEEIMKPRKKKKGLTRRQLYKITGDDMYAPRQSTGEGQAINILDKMLAGEI